MMRKPPWLKVRYRGGKAINEVRSVLKKYHLHTVCEEAACPNQMECFCRSTATFMILGDVCTRNCRFCNVSQQEPKAVSSDEPERVARAASEMNLKYVVVTSVTRDDLEDGGAEVFAQTIRLLRKNDIKCEVLIPDFEGNFNALKKVVSADPYVLNHNVETVPSLYPELRPMADYFRSLDVLKNAKNINPEILTKSGIMAGVGERQAEILEVMDDLRGVSCDILTIGQYLMPSRSHYPVKAYIHPDDFEMLRVKALEKGFQACASGPLVRSSWHAAEVAGEASD